MLWAWTDFARVWKHSTQADRYAVASIRVLRVFARGVLELPVPFAKVVECWTSWVEFRRGGSRVHGKRRFVGDGWVTVSVGSWDWSSIARVPPCVWIITTSGRWVTGCRGVLRRVIGFCCLGNRAMWSGDVMCSNGSVSYCTCVGWYCSEKWTWPFWPSTLRVLNFPCSDWDPDCRYFPHTQ